MRGRAIDYGNLLLISGAMIYFNSAKMLLPALKRPDRVDVETPRYAKRECRPLGSGSMLQARMCRARSQ